MIISGHGARWLVAERSKKKCIALLGAVWGQYAFLRTCKFSQENFWLVHFSEWKYKGIRYCSLEKFEQ